MSRNGENDRGRIAEKNGCQINKRIYSFVIPAQAGIKKINLILDTGFRNLKVIFDRYD